MGLPRRVRDRRVRRARAVCAACPVKLPCLRDAVEREDSNMVRAGLDKQRLNKLIRLRRARTA